MIMNPFAALGLPEWPDLEDETVRDDYPDPHALGLDLDGGAPACSPAGPPRTGVMRC